jgi:dinuclear metal center YbgI/SA1388 family protein
MLVSTLVEHLEEIAPLSRAAPWDNVGLLVGTRRPSVQRVLLTVDLTGAVVDEAVQRGCELIVAYHPPIFAGLKRIEATSPCAAALRHDIAVYSPHTAWDAAAGGVNDALADVLALTQRRPIQPNPALPRSPHDRAPSLVKLVTFVPEDALATLSNALFAAGAGRIGNYTSCSFRVPGTGTFFGDENTNPAVGIAQQLQTVSEIRLETMVPADAIPAVVAALRQHHPYEEPAFDLVCLADAHEWEHADHGTTGMGRIGHVRGTVQELIARVQRALGLHHLLVAGPTESTSAEDDICAAVCAGAGGELAHQAARQGATFLLTGELRHHDALALAERGVTAVCTLHSHSERFSLQHLAARLRERAGTDLECYLSDRDREPFAVVSQATGAR